jgi:hypothetical protein
MSRETVIPALYRKPLGRGGHSQANSPGESGENISGIFTPAGRSPVEAPVTDI